MTIKRHGEARIDRIDKNGTEHWIDHNCPKCDGSGYLHGYEHVDGARCWKCDATGYHPHAWTVKTPEYATKLTARRDAKRRKQNLENRTTFLTDNGFNPNGVTYVATGKTFDIKDELKAAGAKYRTQLGWCFLEKPETFSVVEMTVADCFFENDIADLHWKALFEIREIIQERTPKDEATTCSQYLGEVGSKLTVTVTLKKSFSFDNDYGYYGGTTWIHNFEDADGNVIIWKTTKSLDETTTCELTGTVKEHSKYKGICQTALTRCKVKIA